MYRIGTIIVVFSLTLSACSGDSTSNTNQTANEPIRSNEVSNTVLVIDNFNDQPTNNDSNLLATNASSENLPINVNSTNTVIASRPSSAPSDTTATTPSNSTNQTTAAVVTTDVNQAQNQEPPAPCIGDTDKNNVRYCVNPDTRLFSATKADGSNWWSFTLPGDNNANEIEAVVLVRDEIVLIADKAPTLTDANVNEKYEISKFNKSGSFVETLNVSLFPDNTLYDCSDAWCPYHILASALPYANSKAETMLAREATLPNGDAGLVIGWSRYHSKEYDESAQEIVAVFEGGVVSMLDISNGKTVAERLFPSETITSVNAKANERIDVVTSEGTTELTSNLLLTNQGFLSVARIGGSDIMRWMAYWNFVVTEDPIRNMSDKVERIETAQQWQNGTAIVGSIDAATLFFEHAIERPTLTSGETNADFGYSESVVQSNCSAGGTVTISSQAFQPTQDAGDGLVWMKNKYYAFNQCAFVVASQEVDEAGSTVVEAGAYLLQGDMWNTDEGTSSRNGSSSTSQWHVFDFQMTEPDGTLTEILGGFTESNEDIDARAFARSIGIDGVLSGYSESTSLEVIKRRDNFQRTASLVDNNFSHNWQAEVFGDIFDLSLGDNTLHLYSTQPFVRFNNAAITNKTFDTFDGEISIEIENAEKIIVKAVSDAELPYSREWISVDVDNGLNGSTSTTTIPLQSFYAPVSINAD